MEYDKVDVFVMQHNKQFSAQDMMIVRSKLEGMTENNFMQISNTEFKSPTTAIVLSWFLSEFGVGAFYVKKIGFGVAQILVWILYLIFYFAYFANMCSSEGEIYNVLMSIVAIAIFILFIVGIINARKWTQQYNFNKFMETAQLL